MRARLLLCLLLLTVPLTTGFDDDPYPERHSEARLKALGGLESGALARREVLDPNQEQYDTRYLDLDMSFDTAAGTVDGAILIRVTVTGAPISTVVLDLDEVLSVDAVGLAATGHSHAGDLLTLSLDRTYDPGETLDVRVEWSGSPNEAHGAFGFDTADGKTRLRTRPTRHRSASPCPSRWWP